MSSQIAVYNAMSALFLMERSASNAMAASMYALQLPETCAGQQAEPRFGEGNLRSAVDNFYGVDSASMREEELGCDGNGHVER